MKAYHDLVQKILDEGVNVYNTRTNSVCRTIVGEQISFDVREGFPALTTRKFPFKNTVGELLGFFRGVTSAEDFRKLGCSFWDANANETKDWLKNIYRKGTDDTGNIYGKQWTSWPAVRVATTDKEEHYLVNHGWKYIGKTNVTCKEGYGFGIYRKHINQLENVVRTILTNPTDRRIIVSGWNVGELDTMCLSPCHMDYRFIPFEDSKILNVVMTIRSWDVWLGSPSNIASTAIFLQVVARLTGYHVGKVVIQAANVHLYENSIPAAKELLTREHFDRPILRLSDNIKPITNMAEIKGVFTRIEPTDITLDGYQSHDPIKVEMVA